MFLRLTVIAAILFTLGQAVFLSLDLWDNFAKQGNDDILRLVMVRDFIAGQGWYDMVQYRVLPPDGMPLHWSRYIDLGIAAIVVPLSFFFPMPMAELLAASIWPTLIQLLALTVVTISTRRLFGTVAACFAVVCLVLWPITGGWHSAAGNLDHHNVQMLMMMLMAVCAVWPDRPYATGMIGGLAAAFSLAVGLETVPFVLGVGIIILGRVLLARTQEARQALLVFCGVLSISSVVFWVGQTAPEIRMQPMCDRLSTPILSVVWTATIASAVPLLVFRSNAATLQRLAGTIILTLIGVALSWSLLSTCLAGPYGNLPQDMQDFISVGVDEALPGIAYFFQHPETTMLFLPALTLVPVLIGFDLFSNWRAADMTSDRRVALLGLGLLSVIGFLMMLVQMRAATLSGSILPILVGYILARLFATYKHKKDSLTAFGGLLLATIFISPTTVVAALKPVLPVDNGAEISGADCRTYEAIVALNEIPKALLLPHFNVAPSILWLTHHDVLSAGYHTSAVAITNSVRPFTLEEDALRDYIAASGATHFLLCNNTPYAGQFVPRLAAGEEVDWLRRVPLSDENQVLLQVVLE
ncbi:MAG: hypothetical protein AAFP85_15975 [Pseudomonadota bacterium]